MRITLGMQTNETLLNLNDQQDQINTLSQEISSGKQLLSPSDNPDSWSQIMSTNQTIREYNSFLSNVNFATGWGQTTESALNELSGLLSQAKQVAISAGSSTGTAESGALATQVNGILQQALSIANTQYDNQYIFAGTATDTAPYSINSSTGAVTYNGNTGPIEVKTNMSSAADPGMTTVNLNGEAVFGGSTSSGGSNVLNDIWSLEQAITSGNSSGISNSITTLGNDFNQINNQLTTVGSQLSTLTSQQSALNTMVTNEKGVLSNLQDTDIASATVKLSQAQTAFQAALQVTSLLDNLNLSSILSGGAAG